MGSQAKRKQSVEEPVTKSEVIEIPNTKEEAPVDEQHGTKRNIPVVEYTEETFGALSAEELLTVMTPRISERRALKVLLEVISDGTVTIEEPPTLADWTYKAIAVEGADLTEVSGAKTPKVSMTQKDFAALDGPGMAKLIEEHTTEKRASQIMLALMEYGLVLTPEQVVALSNNRIKIEGVTLPSTSTKRDSVILVKGVQVNGNSNSNSK